MIRFIKYTLLFFSFSLLTFSCQKETLPNLNYGIDPANDLDLICKALRINGINIEGDMPIGNAGSGSITATYPTAVEVSAGVLLYIPYQLSDLDNICNLYIQVEGADNYWETQLTLDPTSQQPYFEILIPRFVQEGAFNFQFSIEDCDGNITPAYYTLTTVSPIADCETGISGSVGITVRSFVLGEKAGTVTVGYDMYDIPDRLDLRYNGEWIESTGTLFSPNVVIPDCNGNPDGFVSGVSALTFQYDPKVSTSLEVYVSGCNQGTLWDIWVDCPE
ncbi:MAG: hypothetical protein GYB31_21055 [Bacteroidetes bacterium]|nr:hypothetical protein [Bacteroidota bacterium]